MKNRYPISYYIIGITLLCFLLQKLSAYLFWVRPSFNLWRKDKRSHPAGANLAAHNTGPVACFDSAYRFQHVRSFCDRPCPGKKI